MNAFPLIVQSVSTLFSSHLFFPLHISCPSLFLWCSCPVCVGWLSMFQATAPVSIPVGPELAGIGSGNGIGPGTGTGTGNGISVSWQQPPPVIFKGALVSEALSHAFLSQFSLLPSSVHLQPLDFFCISFYWSLLH